MFINTRVVCPQALLLRLIFVPQEKRNTSGVKPTSACLSAKMFMSPGSSEEDIDDVIDEICNDSFAKMPLKLKSNSARLTPENNSAAVQTHRRRCCPVYLGGSSSPNGIGTNISKRTCDQLRCTACDFRVSLFNDYIWDQSCDYLFFRYVSGGFGISIVLLCFRARWEQEMCKVLSSPVLTNKELFGNQLGKSAGRGMQHLPQSVFVPFHLFPITVRLSF
uniref:Cilia- and flagella-associated protein 418 n=1 Tax=Anser cygnoides TaxID=8845 RepID=A0A8B9DHG0_ANSCY